MARLKVRVGDDPAGYNNMPGARYADISCFSTSPLSTGNADDRLVGTKRAWGVPEFYEAGDGFFYVHFTWRDLRFVAPGERLYFVINVYAYPSRGSYPDLSARPAWLTSVSTNYITVFSWVGEPQRPLWSQDNGAGSSQGPVCGHFLFGILPCLSFYLLANTQISQT